MSATFKNAKKKVSQEQLRKMMKEHQKTFKEVKKIDSPLAKYNEHGQLTCILCKSVVRSEAVWVVHINAKQHKQNVEMAKKLKERTNNFSTPLKRPLTPPLPDVPAKKIKGILKNVNSQPSESSTATVETATNSNNLPQDFFDNQPSIQKTKTTKENQNQKQQREEQTDALPEGFFDDPKLDAKARNIEYKNPAEEEWEKFLKEIKEADSKSAAIIAVDQEESTNERQIDEIDEQMKKLNKILDLEKKKEEIVSVMNDVKIEDTQTNDESHQDEEFDEYLDWRSKKFV